MYTQIYAYPNFVLPHSFFMSSVNVIGVGSMALVKPFMTLLNPTRPTIASACLQSLPVPFTMNQCPNRCLNKLFALTSSPLT